MGDFLLRIFVTNLVMTGLWLGDDKVGCHEFSLGQAWIKVEMTVEMTGLPYKLR